MLSTRRARLTYLPIMLAAMAGLIWLGLIVLGEAVRSGRAEGWMMALVLATVLALPTAMLLLPVLGALSRRRRGRPIVPNAGVKVP